MKEEHQITDVKGLKAKVKKMKAKKLKLLRAKAEKKKLIMHQQITLVILFLTLLWLFMLIFM